MVNTEYLKESIIEKVKTNDIEQALELILQLVGIVDDKSDSLTSTSEKEKILETLFDFYELGSSANPKSFLELQTGDVIRENKKTFKIIGVLNPNTFLLRHDNVSMKFVVTYSFDLDELSVGFAGNAYIYDENKVIAEIPYEDLCNIFSWSLQEKRTGILGNSIAEQFTPKNLKIFFKYYTIVINNV